MNNDSFSEKDLEQLRKIWEADLESLPNDASYPEISDSVKSDAVNTIDLSLPEKKEDQLVSLGVLNEAFEVFLRDSGEPQSKAYRNSEKHLRSVINEPKNIKALGDKVRVVINYIIEEFSKYIAGIENKEDGAQEGLSSFRKNVLMSVQMGLETARIMTNDETPMETKVLETLFNALKIPYSPIDVIKTFKEDDQQKTYKLAFKSEEEDLDKEVIRKVICAQAVLRKCKDEEADSETLKTAEEEFNYWQNLAQAGPFPAQRQKKLDEYYRFKIQLRNWDMMMSEGIPYEKMLELYTKLKPKSKKEKNGN